MKCSTSMPGAIFTIDACALAVKPFEIALRVNSPKYVSTSTVEPIRRSKRLKGKTFAHHTSCPCVSATVRTTPARFMPADKSPKGAAAPKAAVVMPSLRMIFFR